MRVLNSVEKDNLEHQLKKTRNLDEWKRLYAILGYDSGKSVGELAHELRVSHYTVEVYLREYTDSTSKHQI